MRARSLSHLSNGALLSALDQAEARDRSGTVELLHYLAEIDRRRLYAPAGYPSMFDWCVKTRHYSEAMASRRIAAARAARRFPEIRDMIADGRLHLTAIALLSKKLTEHNASELLAAAVHKSRRQIEVLLAERFPQPDVMTQVQELAVASSLPSPVTVNFCSNSARSAIPGASESGSGARAHEENAPEASQVSVTASADAAPTSAMTPAPVPSEPHSRLTPLMPKRFGVQFTMDEAMHADLQRALTLLAPGARSSAARCASW